MGSGYVLGVAGSFVGDGEFLVKFPRLLLHVITIHGCSHQGESKTKLKN